MHKLLDKIELETLWRSGRVSWIVFYTWLRWHWFKIAMVVIGFNIDINHPASSKSVIVEFICESCFYRITRSRLKNASLPFEKYQNYARTGKIIVKAAILCQTIKGKILCPQS